MTPPVSEFSQELLKQLERAGTGPRAAEEGRALAAFYAARGHAGYWVKGQALAEQTLQVAAELAQADDWGLTAAELGLPDVKTAGLAAATTPADLAATELALSRAVLRYARQARGGRIDPTQLSNYFDRKPALVEPVTVLEEIAKSTAPDAYLRGLHPQHPQFEKLRQAYIALKLGKAGAMPPVAVAQPNTAGKQAVARTDGNGSALRKVHLAMEQWRWMPREMGESYVWVNIPEFTLRVVKAGRVMHSERAIVGKTDTQTPIFSDEMETIVFHPTWGVPDSIKVKEIFPSLVRGKSLLARHNLRLSRAGRDVDPESVDWTTADIRNFHVYQPPGGGNVLGVVKFLFPNKHQVYMHDTPTKALFNATTRTFSHGCMRIRDPLKLAEVLLHEDKGWTGSRVAAMAAPGAGQNGSVNLTRKIQVHITYFTASVDDAGKLQTFADIYGHEERMQMGLDGKAHLIVKRREDLGPPRAEVIARLAESRPSSARGDWKRSVFGEF